jgi:AraC-like DNA-binding protein
VRRANLRWLGRLLTKFAFRKGGGLGAAAQQMNGNAFLNVKKFGTRKIDVASNHLQSVYGADVKLDFNGNRSSFEMQFTGAAFGELRLSKTEVSNWNFKRNTEGYVYIVLPLMGIITHSSGTRRNDIYPSRLAGVARPFENVDLKVTRGAGMGIYAPITGLIDRAERLTGSSQSEALLSEIVDYIDLSSPVGAALAQNMRSALAGMTNLHSIGMGSLATSGYEELLLNLAVASIFPSIVAKIGRPQADCGPRVICRARDYINEHAAEPIELSRLAIDLGISMRTMQENFQRYFGFSPRHYIIECRLERARHYLLLAKNDTSVTDAALASGFTDLGHFSAKYRDKFGELPSETLRSARQ